MADLSRMVKWVMIQTKSSLPKRKRAKRQLKQTPAQDSVSFSVRIPVGQRELNITASLKLSNKSLKFMRAVAAGLDAGFAAVTAQDLAEARAN